MDTHIYIHICVCVCVCFAKQPGCMGTVQDRHQVELPLQLVVGNARLGAPRTIGALSKFALAIRAFEFKPRIINFAPISC